MTATNSARLIRQLHRSIGPSQRRRLSVSAGRCRQEPSSSSSIAADKTASSSNPSVLDEESYPPLHNSSFFTSTDAQLASPSSSSASGSTSSSSSQKFPSLSYSPSALSTFGAPAGILHQYTSMPPTNLSLKALLELSPSTSSPVSQDHVHQSALFTSRELPIRLARRVAAFRALPFIVGANPHVGKVARLYAESFETLANWRNRLETGGQGEEEGFVDSLRELVERHRDNVPTLARGFKECSQNQYVSPTLIASFLDEAIHARIGIRLIAEQHLSLASSYFRSGSKRSSSSDTHSSSTSSLDTGSIPSPGTLHTDLSPYSVLKHVGAIVTELCQSTLGTAPKLLIEGHKDATYTGVPVHLEYVLTELLKNSFRATVELKERLGEKEVRPVKVTIARSRRHVSLRIRDRGGGIHPKDLSRIFSYAFTTAGRRVSNGGEGAGPSSLTTAEEDQNQIYAMQATAGGMGSPSLEGLTSSAASALQSGLGTLAGLGYGLPMARIYSTYFGGGSELGVVSLWGEGCDTFVKLLADPVRGSGGAAGFSIKTE